MTQNRILFIAFMLFFVIALVLSGISWLCNYISYYGILCDGLDLSTLISKSSLE